MKYSLLLVPVLCLLMVSGVPARTLYVPSVAYPTIRAGVDSASAGDTVLVECGTYYEHDIQLKGGIYLLSETGHFSCATIDAGQLGRVLYCDSLDATVYVEGFTITGGRAQRGGGMYCRESHAELKNCLFQGNSAEGAEYTYGGGLYCYFTPCVLSHCIFHENSGGIGGGAYCEGATFSITDCRFSSNLATWGAGAQFVAFDISPWPQVTRCMFCWNRAQRYGGGIFSRGANRGITFTECTFVGNVAENDLGGGIYFSVSSPHITNCTFAWNGGVHGGAICCWSDTPATIDNTIFAYSTRGAAVYCEEGMATATLTCCDVYQNAGGDYVGCISGQNGVNGNFSACPSFCNVDLGDFRLCDQSPCLPGNHPYGYDCGLIGAWDLGCYCEPTRSEPTTWSAIKSMYE
jgi:hypothetical protein